MPKWIKIDGVYEQNISWKKETLKKQGYKRFDISYSMKYFGRYTVIAYK